MSEPVAGRVNRRALMTGGATAAVVAALGLAAEGDAEEAGLSEEDLSHVLIGTVTAHTAADGVTVTALEDAQRIDVRAADGARIVRSDGTPQALTDFAVGDEVAVLADASAAVGDSALRARSVVPCVLGRRADVER